jgi:hypothetical protein
VRKVVEMTLHRKSARATHWSTRTMAATAGISESSVRRIWRSRAEAAPGESFQAQPRSRVHRETGGYRRSVPEFTRTRHGSVRRRSERSATDPMSRRSAPPPWVPSTRRELGVASTNRAILWDGSPSDSLVLTLCSADARDAAVGCRCSASSRRSVLSCPVVASASRALWLRKKARMTTSSAWKCGAIAAA